MYLTVLVDQVYLRPWGANEEPDSTVSASQQSQSSQDIFVQSNAFPSATLLERWLFHYEPIAPEVNLQRRRAQLARIDPPALYKRAVSQLCISCAAVKLLLELQTWPNRMHCTGGDAQVPDELCTPAPRIPPVQGVQGIAAVHQL